MVKVTIELDGKKKEFECDYFMGIGVTSSTNSEGVPVYQTHSVCYGVVNAKDIPSIISSWIVQLMRQIFKDNTRARLSVMVDLNNAFHDRIETELNKAINDRIEGIMKEIS